MSFEFGFTKIVELFKANWLKFVWSFIIELNLF